MKFNQQLKEEIEKFKDYVIVVEGKKDVNALKSYGFEKVYTIHQNGTSIKERAEQIMLYMDKKDKVCILTDLDRRGRQLYMLLKTIFQELGARLDSSLRGIFIKAKISHIEGFDTFMRKVENIN